MTHDWKSIRGRWICQQCGADGGVGAVAISNVECSMMRGLGHRRAGESAHAAQQEIAALRAALAAAKRERDEARIGLASLADVLNTWARELDIEETGGIDPVQIQRVMNLVWSVASRRLRDTERERTRLRANLAAAREAFDAARESGKRITDDVLQLYLDERRKGTLACVPFEMWRDLERALAQREPALPEEEDEEPLENEYDDYGSDEDLDDREWLVEESKATLGHIDAALGEEAKHGA